MKKKLVLLLALLFPLGFSTQIQAATVHVEKSTGQITFTDKETIADSSLPKTNAKLSVGITIVGIAIIGGELWYISQKRKSK